MTCSWKHKYPCLPLRGPQTALSMPCHPERSTPSHFTLQFGAVPRDVADLRPHTHQLSLGQHRSSTHECALSAPDKQGFRITATRSRSSQPRLQPQHPFSMLYFPGLTSNRFHRINQLGREGHLILHMSSTVHCSFALSGFGCCERALFGKTAKRKSLSRKAGDTSIWRVEWRWSAVRHEHEA